MSMRAVHIAALVLGCVVLATSVATAETQVVTATHTYIMGDNDSRNDARQLCFMEAKKKVLAQAGALIESRTEVRNFQLTESQIRSYSAAVLSVETINEEYGIANGRTTLSLTVRASVDMEEVRARLRAIAADSTIQKRIEAQQKQIGQLESQVRQLSGQLNTAQTARATELRKERNIIVGEVRELDDKRLAVLKLMQTAEAKARFVEPGMTKKDVVKIAGEPRGQSDVKTRYGSMISSLNYGNIWVVMALGADVVQCVSREPHTCRKGELAK